MAKLGIFDSGLGGLLIAKSIRKSFPEIDMIYFGDTLHLPYGNRSAEAIYEYSRRSMDFLFSQDCQMIIMACNTASASALRRLQQNYLLEKYPERRILGVVVPTLECATDRGYKRIGVIGTNFTINSGVYDDEIKKINPDVQIFQNKTPLLVPLIENDGMQWAPSVLEHYLSPLLAQNIDSLILGCTHYNFLKPAIERICGKSVKILAQDEIIPEKLADYFKRHPYRYMEIDKNSKNLYYVSDLTDGYLSAATKIYGTQLNIHQVEFCQKNNYYYVSEGIQ